MMHNSKIILLSFDVEEFDLPLEYNKPIGIKEQLDIGYRGLLEINEVLHLKNVYSTLFTTAFFAEHYPLTIAELSVRHEIASHTYYHTRFEEADLKSSKQKLEEITGKVVYGLRMPKMQTINTGFVSNAGYTYNSSINPTWIPGRYNNLNVSRHAFKENGIIQFPVSVTPCLRIPLFWLTFKNIPFSVFIHLMLRTLRQEGYVSLYFHPWEFTDIGNYNLPFYLKKGCNKVLLQKLAKLIKILLNEGEFMLMHEFIKINATNI